MVAISFVNILMNQTVICSAIAGNNPPELRLEYSINGASSQSPNQYAVFPIKNWETTF